MDGVPKSPRVISIEWGSVVVAGYVGKFRDVKLFPGGAREWDWNETGTRHKPGIQLADATELIDKGSKVVILSRGMDGALDVMPETIRALAKRKLVVHVLETMQAVLLYNQLIEKELVGALIQSTW